MNSIANQFYPQVLFDYGKQNNNLHLLFIEAQFVLELLEKDDSYLSNFLANNNIKKNDRKHIIKDIFEKRITKYFLYFLYTIIDLNDGFLVTKIIKKFLGLCCDEFSILFIKVTSAFPIDTKKQKQLEIVLSKYFDSKVILDFKIDSHVLGGIKIQTSKGSIDTTISTKLHNIKIELSSLPHDLINFKKG